MIRRQYPAWARRRHRGAPDGAIMEELAIALTAMDELAARALLHRDVRLTIDSGAPALIGSTPLEGRVATASALVASMAPGVAVTIASINGAPGLVLTRDEAVVGVIVAEPRARMLRRIWVVCNAEKLRHWNRR